jgi:heavy metal translocating P-type ATPase
VGRRAARQKVGENTLVFCCHGCLQVFLLLSAESGELPEGFRESELYRTCVESGIIALGDPPSGGSLGERVGSPGVKPSGGSLGERVSSPGVKPSGGSLGPDEGERAGTGLPPLEVSYTVEGMWCPSCAWLLEEVLGRTSGVVSARAAFVSDILVVGYLPNLISPAEIASRVRRLGYRLLPARTGGASEIRDLGLRLGLSAVVTANIMMISLAVYSGLFFEFPGSILRYFSYPLLGMTSFVLFYAGLPIFRRGLAALRYGSASMDTLIGIGALSAYLYSMVQVARGHAHLYLDTAAMLITLVLLGRYIETRARERLSMGVEELRRVTVGKVRIEEKEHAQWIDADLARPGDRFRVTAGDPVPLDSRVVEGAGLVDRSFLTGESKPFPVLANDALAGGSVVREGNLLLEVERPARESMIGRIAANVEEAMSRKNGYELLAERLARLFVPAVLFMAVGTGTVLWLRDVPADDLLLRSLTILLISCPCVLGLAVPLAKVAMIDRARGRGIVVRDPDALERLKRVDAIVFDKTGTLTEGNFSLRAVVSPGLDENVVLARLAAIEARASHFLAREVVREARKRRAGAQEKAGEFENFPGLGVKGRVQGEEVFVGNRELMERNRLETASDLEEGARAHGREGSSVVFFGWSGRVRGFLAFGDPLRRGVQDLVDTLKKRSVELWLVSGDDETTTHAIAAHTGIERVLAAALPDEKVRLIRELRDRGFKVAMVGDGINDAGALAESDVGMAFGAGMDLIREASDVTFLSTEPRRILEALSLAALASRTVRQNLVFAFLYNAIAIPLAAFGFLNPLIAVAAMLSSSLTVTANTFRIVRARA